MSVSSPFLSPWDILTELGPILEAINKKYPDVPKMEGNVVKYVHDPEYAEVKAWHAFILQCSWKLPTVHEAIVRRDKISQGGACCGLKDLCELLFDIDALRPATVGKVLDAGWREDYKSKIHHKLCCINNIDQQERIKSNNTFPHIQEIPNFSIGGLPGFSYPNYRIPPTIKLERPVNENQYGYRGGRLAGSGYSATPGGSIGYGAEGPTGRFALNSDGVSKVFGAYNRIGDFFTDSPLNTIKGILCKEGLEGLLDRLDDLAEELKSIIRDFPGKTTCSIGLPDLNASINIVINIDECASQFLPPMFMPKHTLLSLTLGDGEEFGIYNNVRLMGGNLGTAFAVNAALMGRTVISDPFKKLPCLGVDQPVGIDRYSSDDSSSAFA